MPKDEAASILKHCFSNVTNDQQAIVGNHSRRKFTKDLMNNHRQ